MNLFLDASVVLAACGRPVGASRAVFDLAPWAEVLLTHDRGDFGAVMGTGFYGLEVLMPGGFLERERAAGRLK